MTYLLGLTGSIGSGKSTTAAMFREEGVPVWDADAAVHALYAPGGAAVPVFARHMPAAVKGDRVDRDRLKTMIAEDPAILEKIETLVHPLLAKDRTAFIAAQNVPLIVFDIPLLFETKADHWLWSVLVVTIAPDIQKSRVLARDGMTEALFAQMLARQMPVAEKINRADHVIITKDMESTRKAVRNLIAKLDSLPPHRRHA